MLWASAVEIKRKLARLNEEWKKEKKFQQLKNSKFHGESNYEGINDVSGSWKLKASEWCRIKCEKKWETTAQPTATATAETETINIFQGL